MKKNLKGPEVTMKCFEPFKNGVLNCKCPREYNWALGFTMPGLSYEMHSGKNHKRAQNNFEFTLARVNGQHVVSNTWQ